MQVKNRQILNGKSKKFIELCRKIAKSKNNLETLIELIKNNKYLKGSLKPLELKLIHSKLE